MRGEDKNQEKSEKSDRGMGWINVSPAKKKKRRKKEKKKGKAN